MVVAAEMATRPFRTRVRPFIFKQRLRRAHSPARSALWGADSRRRRKQLGIAAAFGLKMASTVVLAKGKSETVSVSVSLLSGTTLQISIAPDDTVEVLKELVAKARNLPCSRRVDLLVNNQELPSDSIALESGTAFTAVVSSDKICDQCEYERIRHKLLCHMEKKEACGINITEGCLVAWYIDEVEKQVESQDSLLQLHDMLMNIIERMICIDGAIFVHWESPDAFQRELVRNPDFRCQNPLPWPPLHCPVITCLASSPDLIGKPHLAVLDSCCPWAPKPSWNMRLAESQVTPAAAKLLALLQKLFKDKREQMCLSRADGMVPADCEVPVDMTDVVEAIQRHNVNPRVAHTFMRSQLVRQNFRIEGERLYRSTKP